MSRFDWYSISEVINDFQPQTSENDHMLTARSLFFLIRVFIIKTDYYELQYHRIKLLRL